MAGTDGGGMLPFRRTLAISVSRDKLTVWAHYSRQRVIAYLLHSDISIETDWPFPQLNGCFITFEEVFTSPTWTCLHSLTGQNRSTRIPNHRYTFTSCMIWQYLPAARLVVHNSCDFEAVSLASSVTHCARDHRLDASPSPSCSWDNAHARCCHLCR